MISPLLTCLVLAFVGQRQTNYSRVIVHPNPANGYEEYVRASDVVHNQDLSVLLSWSKEQYDNMLQLKKELLSGGGKGGDESMKWDDEMEVRLAFAKKLHDVGFLGVQQMAAQEFGGALDLVRGGNLKSVWDPREKLNAVSIFPELADFKTVAKLFRADAYARFAKGDSGGATGDLIDGLTFARKIGGGTLISELVSTACQAIAFATFDENLTHLSDKDAQAIMKYADGALKEPISYLQALDRERQFTINSIDILFSSPADVVGSDEGDSGLGAFVKGMSADQKRQAREGIARRVNEYYDNLIKSLSGSESTWQATMADNGLPIQPSSVNSVNDLVDTVLNMTTPVHAQATLVVLRIRTQLRLLDLHAHVIDFRWRNNRLPKDLKEATPATLVKDPLTQAEFVYEITDQGYKLYSKGLDTTGPIELKYRRPANLPGQDDGPIPPLGVCEALRALYSPRSGPAQGPPGSGSAALESAKGFAHSQRL